MNSANAFLILPKIRLADGVATSKIKSITIKIKRGSIIDPWGTLQIIQLATEVDTHSPQFDYPVPRAACTQSAT